MINKKINTPLITKIIVMPLESDWMELYGTRVYLYYSECKHNFKWPSVQRQQCQINWQRYNGTTVQRYNGNLDSFFWASMNYISMLCFLKIFFHLRFLCKRNLRIPCLLKATEKLFFLIRLRFQGYRCKSGIAIFAWTVTWVYAYSPFYFIFFLTIEDTKYRVIKQ